MLRSISINLKIQIFVTSSNRVLYASETWLLRKVKALRLSVFERETSGKNI